MNFLIKIIPAIFFSLALCSCAAIELKRGLLINNKSHVSDRREGVIQLPRSYGYYEKIRLDNPPVTIQLHKNPDTSVLFVGPGILLPIPIIPWIPGMIKALKSPPVDVSPDNRVKIVITLDPYQNFRESVHLRFEPNQAKLIVGAKTLSPISWESKPLNYGTPNKVGQENAECYSKSEGEIIIAPQSSSKCDQVAITVTFDITYPEISKADFEIGEVMVNHQAVSVPRTSLINRGKLKLWWAYTINT